MAFLKLRFSAKKIFGRIPKTEEVEANDKALREEYAQYTQFTNTPEYKRYAELKEFVGSGEIQRVKEELNLLKYPNSELHQKELEYKKLSKSKPIKNYLRVKNTKELEDFKAYELSGKPLKFKELKNFVESQTYTSQRAEHKKNKTEEYEKELEYKKLKKDKELKHFLKLKKWQPFIDYFELEDSETIQNYLELEKYIGSKEFIERKSYLKTKNKFEKSDAFQKLKEYDELRKSSKIVWFHSLENTSKFDEIKRWELSFHDDFDEKTLSKNWITRYFWGEALLNKSYSLAGDKHFYPDTENIEIADSTLKIKTQKQNAEGLAWDKKYGFVPKSFQYTSGIINTGQAFRQKNGRFEAKLKFSNTPGVYHAFWLVGDTMLPHIDILRKEAKGASFKSSLFWQNGNDKKPQSVKSSLNGFNFSSDFFILGIDWLQDKIVWKINGVPYMETSQHLPEEPVYLVISSGVSEDASEANLPALLEVDWIKCWREVEQEK